MAMGFPGGDGDVFVGEHPETKKNTCSRKVVCFFLLGGDGCKF